MTTYAIDFGTSNSLVAAVKDGEVAILPLDPRADDPTILKSVFYTPAAGEWYFGSEAIAEYSLQFGAGRFFRSVKKYLPDATFMGTVVHNEKFSIADLIAKFLRRLRERANEACGVDVTDAIIGRPAVFSSDDSQDRLAEDRLLAAAKSAGFRNVKFLAEPIAAAFDVKRSLTKEALILVCDLGGGTSDFTVARLRPGLTAADQILSVGGLSVAGDMFDGSIMRRMLAPHFGSEVTYMLPMGSNHLRLPEQILNRFTSAADINFLGRADIMNLLRDAERWSLNPDDAKRMRRLFTVIEEHLGYALFREIERTKIEFGSKAEVDFVFNEAGLDVAEKLFAADFRALSYDLVEKIFLSMDSVLRAAGVNAPDIDAVFATGGTARLQSIQDGLHRRFGKDKINQYKNFHSVVGGLAAAATSGSLP